MVDGYVILLLKL